MKKTIILLITTIMLLTQVCKEEEKCVPTTYRPEIGIGYVFMYDSINNISYPVEGAVVIMENWDWKPGMYSKRTLVSEERYITNAEGRYQARFIEKVCTVNGRLKKEISCNTYVFHYEKKKITGILGYSIVDIKNDSKNGVFILDTIKLYEK